MDSAVVGVNLFVARDNIVSFSGEAKIDSGKFTFTSDVHMSWGKAKTVVVGTFRAQTSVSGTATIKFKDDEQKSLTFQAQKEN